MKNSYSLFHQNDFEIHTLEYFRKNEQHNQNASTYKMFWIKEGNGSLHNDKNIYTIKTGSFYCFGTGTINIISGNYIEGYALCLSPDFFYSLQAELSLGFFLHPLIKQSGHILLSINTDDAQAAEDVLIKLRKEFITASLLREEMLKSLLRLFFLYIARKAVVENGFSKSREAIIMEAFTALLIKNISTQKKVADYAKALHVTPGYLNHAVKKASGYTASFHIQQQVITQAKQKALCADYSMKEIAYDLGFDDMAHFSKFFKNNSGISFTGFKKSLVISN